MNNKAGYTLIEIMVAMAILAIISLPIFNVFSDSIKVNKMADDQYRADFIAQKIIEDFRGNSLPSELSSTIQIEGFTVNIDYSELENDVEDTEDKIDSNFILPPINIDLELYENTNNKISLKNTNNDLGNLNLTPNEYVLEILSESNNHYKAFISYISESTQTSKEFGQVVIIDYETPLTIRFSKNENLNIKDDQRTTFTLLNNTSKDVEIYVVNDQLDNLRFKVDSASNRVKFIRNISNSPHISDDRLRSFDVEVTVNKNNTEYTKLKTVISE